MPYIKGDVRHYFDEAVDKVPDIFSEGELNYIVTKLCSKYIKGRGSSYSTYNTIVGALECCKLEMYRRVIGHYENKKIKENGEVYDKDLVDG